ncbi:MAG TPA: redoxin domain-containing protein [Gemmatimonadota bacterium]|nr:redoxin domain-containing protein [Gemmatimonadota bacterium]
MRAMRWTIVPALSLAVLGVAACGSGSEARTEEEAASSPASAGGRVAPGFALETLTGDSLSLDDLADRKVVLVNFWASWCEPCKEEIPVLIELHEEYGDEGFMVLGATVDDLPRDSRDFVEEMGIPYPSVITTPRMREEWRLAPWLPTTYLLVEGRIADEWVGPQTREEFEFPIRVGLGLSPAIEDVIRTDSRS